MKYDLDPAKAVLLEFLNEFEEILKTMSQPILANSSRVSDGMLEFDTNQPIPACNSFWEKEKA
jgi:hypothetical protein